MHCVVDFTPSLTVISRKAVCLNSSTLRHSSPCYIMGLPLRIFCTAAESLSFMTFPSFSISSKTPLSLASSTSRGMFPSNSWWTLGYLTAAPCLPPLSSSSCFFLPLYNCQRRGVQRGPPFLFLEQLPKQRFHL